MTVRQAQMLLDSMNELLSSIIHYLIHSCLDPDSLATNAYYSKSWNFYGKKMNTGFIRQLPLATCHRDFVGTLSTASTEQNYNKSGLSKRSRSAHHRILVNLP